MRAGLRAPWLTFVAVRVAMLLGTVATILWIPRTQSQLPEFSAWGQWSNLVFGTFEHWDGDNFMKIVHGGYTDQSLPAFMPGYPALAHAVGWLTGSQLVAAILVSLICGAIAAQLVYLIGRDLIGEREGRIAAVLLSVYPIAYVFTAPYSEGLFLAAATGATLAAMRGRFWLAGLLAGVAADTRFFGVVLVPMLLLLAWPAARGRFASRLLPLIAGPLAALAGASVYFHYAVGDNLAFLHAQSKWGRAIHPLGPLTGVWYAMQTAGNGYRYLERPETDQSLSGLAAVRILDLVLLVVAAVLTVIVFRKLGLAWGLYATLVLAVVLTDPVKRSGEPLESLSRILLCDFPLFLASGALLARAPSARAWVYGTSIAVGTVACIAFSRMYWVA